MEEIKKIIETLSPLERQILPFLQQSIENIMKKTNLDKTSVERALQFLSNKNIIKIYFEKKKIVDLGRNGIAYLKSELPERKLINVLSEKKKIPIDEAEKLSDLTKNEFMAAIGVLKNKGFIYISDGKIGVTEKIIEASKKMPEEILLEKLPIDLDKLNEDEKEIVKKLQKRKEIIEIKTISEIKYSLTNLGREVIEAIRNFKEELIEDVTPEVIKSGEWRKKRFRRYDIKSKVPKIYGGKRQPYYYFLEEVRKKLTEMGFKEMTGPLLVSEFWNFDALFQPQFHAARDWSDCYRVKDMKADLPDKKLVERIKKIHEVKWKYKWNEEKARNVILRPQGTVLSAITLSKEKYGKFFAIARVFRPDVVDSKHLSEFNQVEGIIIGKNLNFSHLLYVLKKFAIKIAGAKQNEIRFRPSYFPFTEPSVEMDIKHKKLGWIEIGGAGIFRKEVTEPLTNMKDKDLRVLAWGLGIDRLAMIKLEINDIRELFSQDLEFLRNKRLV